jgi:hypothetical protein
VGLRGLEKAKNLAGEVLFPIQTAPSEAEFQENLTYWSSTIATSTDRQFQFKASTSAVKLREDPNPACGAGRVLPVIPAWLSTINTQLSTDREADPFQFRGEQVCLLGRELDQRRPHPGPFRIVRVDRDCLFHGGDYRRKFPAAENFAHDIQVRLLAFHF